MQNIIRDRNDLGFYNKMVLISITNNQLYEKILNKSRDNKGMKVRQHNLKYFNTMKGPLHCHDFIGTTSGQHWDKLWEHFITYM